MEAAIKQDKRTFLQGMSTFVKAQLGIFAVLTVIGVVSMALIYVKVPAILGIGQYKVTVQLAASGGLYPHANVSYRGTNIGTVSDMHLTPDGVDAQLSIDSDHKVPTDVTANIRSVSAIGEQYVDLVPNSDRGGNLGEGSVIPAEHTSLPPDIGPLLGQADKMLAGLGKTRLKTVIDEAFLAFDGTGPDLQRFLDSAQLLVQEADKASGPTKQLIDQVGPLLDTQTNSSDAIKEWTRNLGKVTDQLRAHDPQLRQIIEKAPGTIDTSVKAFQDLKPTLPLLLANLVSLGQVTSIYQANVEQILVVFPPLVAGLATAATGGPVDEGALVDFDLAVNDPPACTTGFLPPSQWRSPADLSVPNTPNNLFCKVAQNSTIDVRGIRNSPCETVPGKRAATVEECKHGSYVPEGNVPVLGPPQPVKPTSYTVNSPMSTARPYDPQTGTFIGTDGLTYSQPNVGAGGAAVAPRDLQTMMRNQQGK